MKQGVGIMIFFTVVFLLFLIAYYSDLEKEEKKVDGANLTKRVEAIEKYMSTGGEDGKTAVESVNSRIDGLLRLGSDHNKKFAIQAERMDIINKRLDAMEGYADMHLDMIRELQNKEASK